MFSFYLDHMLFISNFMLCINNYLLDLYNLINQTMRKPYMMFLISGILILQIFQAKLNVSFVKISSYVLILIPAGLGITIGIYRLVKKRQGVPPEDEFSLKILYKASSAAYYLSLIMWFTMISFHDKIKLDKDSLIITGVLGMSVFYCICWIYYRVWGTKDV